MFFFLSLCDIRRDCCYNFVSERDFGRDAQRVYLLSRNVSDESLGRDETSFVKLTPNDVFSQVTVNFMVNFESSICAVWNPYAM